MHSIDIYTDFNYLGFWKYDMVEQLFEEYSQEAERLSENIGSDEVVLYAIFGYDKKSHAMLTADFMIVRMNYSLYSDLVDKIQKNCRIFFKTKRKGVF